MNKNFYEYKDVIFDIDHVVATLIQGDLGSGLLQTPRIYEVLVMLSYGHKVILWKSAKKEECEKCLNDLRQALKERSNYHRVIDELDSLRSK